MNIISNEILDFKKIEKAKKIIIGLQQELNLAIENGFGPFMAAIFDKEGNLIAKATNSVQTDNCSNSHAEINAIKLAEKELENYDLSEYDLSIYVTAEPCIMCLGAIMWSGIKHVYYGVPSNLVEELTGFDEGFKPNWFEEFKKRNIIVYGNIEVQAGVEVLKKYVQGNNKIYKPSR